MKTLLTLFFCLLTSIGFAQVIVDTGISKVYYNAVKKMAYENNILKIPKTSDTQLYHSTVIFTMFNIDTLNKKDTLNKMNINVDDSGINQDVLVNKGEKNLFSLPCSIFLGNDTLDIVIARFKSIWFHEVTKQKAAIYYSEGIKNTNERASPTIKILEFKISTQNYQVGQIIYGEAEITTGTFSNRDENFKEKYIDKQLHCKYVFKIIVDSKTGVYPQGYSVGPVPSE